MNEPIFEIVEHVATLSETSYGMRRELNRIKWNGGEPKWDIRHWNSSHSKMSRGVALADDELGVIVNAYLGKENA